MTGTTRTGVLRASNWFSEGWIKRCLPPEHVILAVKPLSHETEYLVRGAFIPVEGASIWPRFTMHSIEEATVTSIRLTGEIGGSVWTIGEWSSIAAFRDEKESYE